MPLERALMVIGFVLYATTGVRSAIDFHGLSMPTGWAWAYLAFGVGLALASPGASRQRRLLGIAVELPAMLVMAAAAPCEFGALLLAIVAWHVALVMPVKVTAVWVLAQTAAVGWFVLPACKLHDAAAGAISLLGFQTFAAMTVLVAQRESDARSELARTNSELRATQALLAENTRAQERTRIARELHDVLGHDLTALGLQLEVARNVVTDDRSRDHVTRAQEVSSRLLRDVREVVSKTRATEGADLAEALRVLIDDTPGIAVHLTMAEPLTIEDPARAHVVLRCVQEIVTNTMRHAAAKNLWIEIQKNEGGISVDARDDGRGAEQICAGNGLAGMKARLEEMGGVLRVATEPSRAFVVSAWLPSRESATS